MASSRCIVISGPSGVGKGTLIQRLYSDFPELVLSISATTRAKRPSEIDGVHYYFKSEAAFDDLIAADAFFEWCHVHDHRYGTLKAPILDALTAGRWPLVEIDTQGFQKIKRQCPTLSIFIAPPSIQVLYDRLHQRHTESEASIQARLAIAKQELTSQSDYDYRITNDQLTASYDLLRTILNQEIYETHKCHI